MPITGEQLARGVTHLLRAKFLDGGAVQEPLRPYLGKKPVTVMAVPCKMAATPHIRRRWNSWECASGHRVAYGKTPAEAFFNLVRLKVVTGVWNP